MEFTKFSEYTRTEIHEMYFGYPMPSVGAGNWISGYVNPTGTNDLIIFMNIGIPGKTGHDFPNDYDSEDETLTWYGKPGSHSQQPTFQKLFNQHFNAHFFARWEYGGLFSYLGIGRIIDWEDGYPTETSNGSLSECIQIKFDLSSDSLMDSLKPILGSYVNRIIRDPLRLDENPTRNSVFPGSSSIHDVIALEMIDDKNNKTYTVYIDFNSITIDADSWKSSEYRDESF